MSKKNRTQTKKPKMQPMKFELQNNGVTLSWGKKNRRQCSFVFLILTCLFLSLQYFFFSFTRQAKKKFHY